MREQLFKNNIRTMIGKNLLMEKSRAGIQLLIKLTGKSFEWKISNYGDLHFENIIFSRKIYF